MFDLGSTFRYDCDFGDQHFGMCLIWVAGLLRLGMIVDPKWVAGLLSCMFVSATHFGIVGITEFVAGLIWFRMNFCMCLFVCEIN